MLIRDGLVYPGIVNPERIKVNRCGDKDCLRVVVWGDEYDICRDPHMWSSSKPGGYGRGVLNSGDDPKKTERTSRLGEIALAKVFPGLGMDIRYKTGGEVSDFMMGHLSVDIKTAASNYGANCIQVMNDRGYRLSLKSDIYIGSFIEMDARLRGVAHVILVGWELRYRIEASPDVPGRRGNWLNKELVFADLRPLDGMLGAYKASIIRQEAGGV